MAFSFAAAASARASWMKRSATLSTTMPTITVPARASPGANETADSVASRITSGLRMIFIRRRNQPCWRSCATSFGPAVRARSSASVWVRPAAVVCKDRRSSSPSFPAASRTAGETRMFWFFAFFGMAGGSGCGPAELAPSGPAGFTEATAALLASDVVIVPSSFMHAKRRLALAHEHFNLPRLSWRSQGGRYCAALSGLFSASAGSFGPSCQEMWTHSRAS